MFAALYVDGAPASSDEAPETVTLDFGSSCDPTHRCRACGEGLIDAGDGFVSESGESACVYGEPLTDADPDDVDVPHDPERVPLSWCNSAAVHVDESDDSVTVSISVGDPRGAFTFTIRRVPDDVDSDLTGHLIMHTPYAGQPSPHRELTPLHDGTHVVGPYMPLRRLRSVPAA